MLSLRQIGSLFVETYPVYPKWKFSGTNVFVHLDYPMLMGQGERSIKATRVKPCGVSGYCRSSIGWCRFEVLVAFETKGIATGTILYPSVGIDGRRFGGWVF